MQNLNKKERNFLSYRLHKLGTTKVLRTDRVDPLLGLLSQSDAHRVKKNMYAHIKKMLEKVILIIYVYLENKILITVDFKLWMALVPWLWF